MNRCAAILAFTILTILAMFFVNPIHQDQNYHQFADHRNLIGIDNFFNVISNLPFMIIAALGFLQLRKYKTLKLDSQSDSATYLVFFSGVLLTGIGSAYYHYAPSNSTLIWDRLPMTIAFMAFFCLIISYHTNKKTSRIALVPLLLIGIGSIFYWIYTEQQGRGDLRPYVIVQFLPILLVPIMIKGSKSVDMDKKTVWKVIAYYGFAKVFEHYDSQFFVLFGEISGHSVKHVLAAIGTAHVYLSLKKETLREGDTRTQETTHRVSVEL